LLAHDASGVGVKAGIPSSTLFRLDHAPWGPRQSGVELFDWIDEMGDIVGFWAENGFFTAENADDAEEVLLTRINTDFMFFGVGIGG